MILLGPTEKYEHYVNSKQIHLQSCHDKLLINIVHNYTIWAPLQIYYLQVFAVEESKP